MSNKKEVFIFDGGEDNTAFDKASNAANLRGQAYKYNKKTDELSMACEELDRIDEFGSLLIPLEKYEKEDNNKYGIERKEFHGRSGAVILPHQKAAAETFLKTLRGFGLLADVVGSGKTFEAGLVLSELSARNKIESLLVVVPEPLISTWKKVLEEDFGMGIGSIFVANGNKLEIECKQVKEKILRPVKPILISLEDFSKWNVEYHRRFLFDAIVVDEAHNLSIVDENHPEYAKAMYLLSSLMQTKKEFGNNYCLLLSATPHSGNLDSMFRLWYFIRCKGGNPADFIEKDKNRQTVEFKNEKEYYKKTVCENATTVMEFVKNVKIKEIEQNYKEQFKDYLKNVGIDYKTILSGKDEEAIKSRKITLMDDFLNEKENEEIKEKVIATIASTYHNKVLRPIMVRQSKDKINNLKQDIVATNIYYFPLENELANKELVIKDLNDEIIKVDIKNLCVPGRGVAYTYGDAITYTYEGTTYKTKLNSYVKDNTPDGMLAKVALSELTMRIAKAMGPDDTRIFRQKHILDFIHGLLQNINYPDGIKTFFKPFKYVAKRDYVEHKFLDFKHIVDFHKESRIVVFFDYENLREDSELFGNLHKLIDKDSSIKNRIIIAKAGEDIKIIQKEYEEKPNAILLCEDKIFTEGVNLQSGNVIINFTVTPDPLAMNQRIGRVDRLGQANKIYIYSLANLNELEGFGLAFLSAIGIINSNSNDATIISGSSNEKMIAIKCRYCERVKLMPKERYDFYDKLDVESYVKNGELPKDVVRQKDKTHLLKALKQIYCSCEKHNGFIYDDARFAKMGEINITTSQCNSCGSVFRRMNNGETNLSNTGYSCVADTKEKLSMESSKDREYHCSKLCIMMHCKEFLKKYSECPILDEKKNNKMFNLNEVLSSDPCSDCDLECPKKCRPTGSSIEECLYCSSVPTCSAIGRKTVGPHILEFDANWRAKCPACKNGYLEPIKQSTFNKFIRNSWLFVGDGGHGFYRLLEDEFERVNDIRTVLLSDTETRGGSNE